MPRALNYLDKVYTDIYGLITPEIYDKKRYFISFIDDKTRYATIYLIRTREETFSIFSKWLNIEENQENTLLKRLHSDNAKEYKSGDFIDLFNAKGIKSTFTAPYTPEQNGIAERFNRTIVSKIRALLYTAKLPNYYWGEAALAATYLYNRTLHSALEGFITPYEAKKGKKPNIFNIKV